MVRVVKLAGRALGLVSLAVAFASVPSAAQAQTPTPPSFPYTYTNPDGSKTVIPALPKRVVLTGRWWAHHDPFFALGLPIVGFTSSLTGDFPVAPSGAPTFVPAAKLAGVTVIPVTTSSTTPAEPIIALNPDLIIAQSGVSPEEVARLQAIAPTIVFSNFTSKPNQLLWDAQMLPVAKLFGLQQRADGMISRFKQRLTTLRPFTKGTSVAIVTPQVDRQNFSMPIVSAGMAGPLGLAGVTIERSIDGVDPPDPPALFLGASNELLPRITAQKLLVAQVASNAPSEAEVRAFPVFSQIPAVQRNQVYFTKWITPGTTGMANAVPQLMHEMFGLGALLEADLTGRTASRTGLVDLDFGPDGRRVCWTITNTANIGRPGTVRILTGAGRQLVNLTGSSFKKQGCRTLTAASANSLSKAPQKYSVSIDTRSTKGVLKGALGIQSPEPFGGGKTPFVFK